jgi:hypothetical protein
MRHWLVTSIAALAAMPLWAFAGQETPQPSETPIIPELSVVQQFEIDRSDRMTVPVRINNSEPVDFIVDTGAERTVISGDLAQKLALEAGPELRLATITGPATAPSFYIEELALQSHTVEGIEAPALERGNLGGNGLCWASTAWKTARSYLDFRTQHLEVLPSAHWQAPGQAGAGHDRRQRQETRRPHDPVERRG